MRSCAAEVDAARLRVQLVRPCVSMSIVRLPALQGKKKGLGFRVLPALHAPPAPAPSWRIAHAAASTVTPADRAGAANRLS